MPAKISESEWKSTLTSILEELDEQQYTKMLDCSRFEKISKSVKTSKSRAEMPQTIIQHLGVDKSISAIKEAMDQIPRKDSAVQDKLRPFVNKLRKKREEQSKRKKRKHESDRNSADKEPKTKANRSLTAADKAQDLTDTVRGKGNDPSSCANAVLSELDPNLSRQLNLTEIKKTKVVSNSDSFNEEQNVAADELKRSGLEKEGDKQPWRKTIRDLKSSGHLQDSEAIVGKVMQKSGLRRSKTQNDNGTVFFYVSVADDTDCIKLMVFGKPHFQEINEECSYMFRKLITDEKGVKVNKHSKVSETSAVKVPEELEMKARELICVPSPVYSIAEAKTLPEKFGVTVKGTVTEIYRVVETEVTAQQRMTKRQEFLLREDKESISICMWGENTEQVKEISVGDVVNVTNVKTSRYHETVSLSSTGFTRILSIERAPVQKARIEIQAIQSTDSTQTFLEAVYNGLIDTFVVSTQLLASEFNLRLDGDLKKNLLNKMPFSADVEIQGRKIHALQKNAGN